MSEEATVGEELAPLSPEAIAARDKIREMVKQLEEDERARRVSESSSEQTQDQQKLVTLDKLVTVQEDLIRFINLKKVRYNSYYGIKELCCSFNAISETIPIAL